MSARRLVAVLGFSDGPGRELNRVCAARLERAASEACPGDAVLLSGWSRGRTQSSEADLMARAWNGRSEHVLLDRSARTTYDNVVAAAAAARSLAVPEVVLVTSGWHGRRASILLRAALRGSGRRVTLAATDERGSPRARLRELTCWLLVPFQAVLASRSR